MLGRIVLLIVALCALCLPAVAQDARPLRIGVAPHTSSRVIIEMYQPLRLHLQKALGVPASIMTAPDFTEFARRAINLEYDLVITTGHQAELLKSDARYRPLLTYKAPFRAVMVTAAGSKARSARDLTGQPVAGLSPSSLVTLWGLHWMADNGATGTQVRFVSAADSVAQLLLNGEVAAGTMSLANFQGLTPEVQAQLRFLSESPALAGRVYLLSPSESARAAAIDAALWSFADSQAGRDYFVRYKLEGYRKLGPGELEVMAPYAAEVREQLKKSAQ
ncbi:PhnD/SsuA/transferrin family substrate-binding protein [Methyloversatilis universalis]|uniref:PhnD/SsuA/transferrin family substrate-binding protein n=1 Tax=Methyloversatilis universalis TaxID=378211 RepID=UPI000372D356|nr:PhnD/SsuA/transferrin family substrate-binding protein [Methyloversatilis universalis]